MGAFGDTTGRSGAAFGGDAAAGVGGDCPCGSGRGYGSCCGRLHAGEAAGTAEELMRSRYSAFVLHDEPYLLRSWHPRTRPRRLDLDPRQRWTGLRVLAASGGPGDETGEVTYVAAYVGADGRAGELRERARFARRGGRWVYVDGDVA